MAKNRLIYGKMNRNEILYNMNMLKTVNEKLRAASGEKHSEVNNPEETHSKMTVPPNSAAVGALSHR